MKSHMMVDQKMVIAHVYGHSDFFRNNMWFSQTNRRMIDEIANHGTRLRRYVERHGQETVEAFLDAALAGEPDRLPLGYSPHRRRARSEFTEEPEASEIRKLKASKGYMDRFINTPEFMDAQRKKIEDALQKKKRFPEETTKDILEFLIEYAPLGHLAAGRSCRSCARKRTISPPRR